MQFGSDPTLVVLVVPMRPFVSARRGLPSCRAVWEPDVLAAAQGWCVRLRAVLPPHPREHVGQS